MAEDLFNEDFDFDSYVALEELTAAATEAPTTAAESAATEGLFNEYFDFDRHVASEELPAETTEAPGTAAEFAATYPNVSESATFVDSSYLPALTPTVGTPALSGYTSPPLPALPPLQGSAEVNEEDADVNLLRPPVQEPHVASKPLSLSKAQKGKQVRKAKPPGEIRMDKNGLEHRESSDDDWELAVYHHDIWDELLAYADACAASVGGFTHEPAKGVEEWNRTAFCEDQKDWGEDRSARPGVCFVIEKDQVPDAQKPIPWFHGGRRVIDRKNHSMRFFWDVPVTISSAVEGFRLDAMQKLNPNITLVDLLGRTPRQFVDWRGATRGELGTTSLSNRALRFRRSAGVMSWDTSDFECNRVWKDVFTQILGPNCIAANNTASFGRDLTREEVKRAEQAYNDIRAQSRSTRGHGHTSAAPEQHQRSQSPTNPRHPARDADIDESSDEGHEHEGIS